MRKFRVASDEDVENRGWLDFVLCTISITSEQIEARKGILFELGEDDPCDCWWANIIDEETGCLFGLKQYVLGRQGISYVSVPMKPHNKTEMLSIVMQLLDLSPEEIDWTYKEESTY